MPSVPGRFQNLQVKPLTIQKKDSEETQGYEEEVVFHSYLSDDLWADYRCKTGLERVKIPDGYHFKMTIANRDKLVVKSSETRWTVPVYFTMVLYDS